ncbi:MAG: hypothetical protein C0608_05780 [Deltaproteobacteria bacterium]|nr:MAG: hypothetical protein C0608_05780 [Deltaproteobacteria bacterium]
MRKMKIKFTLPFLIALVMAASAMAAPAPDSFADLAQELTPSVVNISSTKIIKGRGPAYPGGGQGNDLFRDFFGDDFMRRFFGGGETHDRKSQSLGSGFIWNTDGYIITNNHVVEGADEVSVKLSNGKEFDAEIVGTDHKTDVALLKIEPGDYELSAVKIGDSENIRVGDWVMAIGNPFGLGHTVTAGIISAKERIIGMGPYDSFLQTDADINFGNSGGPLFGLNGKVIGINAAKNVRGAGIGFAIPINMAMTVVSQLRDDGKVTRAWLGVVIQDLTDEIADSMGLETTDGALVSDVLSDGPADKAGLKRGDVILSFDGEVIKNNRHLPFIVASHKPGAKVDMQVLRKGKQMILSVTLGEMQGDGEEMAQEASKTKLGIMAQEITPELRDALKLNVEEGIVVTDIVPGSAADDAGIARGDVILEVNQEPVDSIGDFRDEIRDAKKDDRANILLLINRKGNTIYVVVKLPKE